MAEDEEAFSTFLQALPKFLQQGILPLDTEAQIKSLVDCIQRIFDVEAMQRKNNARTWLRQLEDISSDINDFLHLTSPKVGSHNKIHAAIKSNSKTGNFRNRRANQKIARQEMKAIKTKLDKISKKLNSLSLQCNTEHEITKMSLNQSPIETLIVSDKNEDQEKIIDILLSVEHTDQAGPYIIPISRKGVGKTTEIAQFIFDDKRVVNHFTRKIWVNASKVIDLGKLLRLIQKPASTLFWVHKTLENELDEEQQILIVLDDIREECVDDRMLQLHVSRCRTAHKFIVSTPVMISRFESSEWDIIKDKLKLGQRYSPQDSWVIFKECVTAGASGFQNHDMNLQLEGIGRSVVKKLGGSPSMIRTIGYVLSYPLEPNFWKWISESEVWKLPVQEFVLIKLIELCYSKVLGYKPYCIRPPCLDQWWWQPEARQHANKSGKKMIGKYAA